METRAIFPLEIRQSGRTLSGRFPYGSTATVSDRGRARKERFSRGAFRFAVEDAEREIHLLSGHEFSKPLASKQNGSLVLEDTDDALTFTATLPELEDMPTYMVDTVKAINAGLVGGISPGFRVPPASAVPGAERLIPEPGNPGVQIRVIEAAVLFELSLVTRPAYPDTDIALRSEHGRAARRVRIWL